jgi:hypothetical protein
VSWRLEAQQTLIRESLEETLLFFREGVELLVVGAFCVRRPSHQHFSKRHNLAHETSYARETSRSNSGSIGLCSATQQALARFVRLEPGLEESPDLHGVLNIVETPCDAAVVDDEKGRNDVYSKQIGEVGALRDVDSGDLEGVVFAAGLEHRI